MTKLISASLKVLAMCTFLLMAGRAHSATIQVTANLTGVNNWHNTDEYVLNGFIYVLDGAVLNIDPGTVIRGKAGTGLSSAALFITQGAKINALGTRENPIIFTSEADDLLDPNDIPLYTRNLWGGVVIYGKSVLNTASDVAGNAASPKYDLFEGLPDTVISGQHINAYGGNNDDDNSGVMRYCSIRYSSTVILPNKEINALSLCAVGRGTTIDHIECFAAGDDSVEFFGGTVNTKYMVSIFSDDDNFDIDQGYRGKNQFWFAIAAPDRKDTGGEWNGEPNGIAVGNAPIGNFEIYNATYIGAGTNSTGNRAFISREYAAPNVYNSIFTEYNIGGNIDARSGGHFTNGIATFSDNIFWNFASNGVPQTYWQTPVAEWVMTNAANNNQFVNPMLRSISRTNIPANQLDPRLQFGSPALSSSRTPPNNDFYSRVAYKGAFDDADLWADGWTFASQVGLLSPDSPLQVTANISADATWRSGHEYVLNGFIYVLSNAVLTIEPGTVVRGKAGTGLSSAALFITQGAKIFANGTRANPIIFTSEGDDLLDPNDIPLYTRNLWGGVVIYGKSVLNTASDVAGNAASPKYDLFEGLPDTVINGQHINAYGGNDDNDNSGVMRYCSIRYSSTVILPNKEINALSLCAVGRGTTIENIECFAAGDDSVEFFGGTVNTKYMVSIFSDDDNFDIDQGYRGHNQFWFAIAAPDRKDQGGEWNGEPNGVAAGNAPIGNFEIYNATYIGAGTNTTGNRAFISREYAAPKVYNSIFTEYNIGGNIDDRSGLHFTNGIATFSDNIFWNFASNGVPQPYWQNVNAQRVITNAANNNQFVNPQLRAISRTNIPANVLDPRPQFGSPALSSSRTAPNDGFYSPVAYKGAFDGVNLWADGWTYASQVGLLSTNSIEEEVVVQVTANISADATWRSGHEYVLNGFIYVLSNAVLTIEPGTVVRGKAGTGLSSAALFITQGAKIFANGTRANPIIFTSEGDDLLDPNDIPLYTRNLWGGVVIYGKSVLNTASDVAGNAASPKYDLFEGLPDTVINGQHINAYGGNDDNDNSGVMRYCSIRYSSTVILPNKEINALSLCAVGRGTTIENIECFAAGDDSVEFFGGTVNTKYMVSIFSDDDNFDIDQGYRGHNQFWFAIAAPDRKDQGGEWNGEPNGVAAGNAPIGNFEIYNATYIGAGTNTTGNRAFISREYAAPKVYNSIFTEYNIGGNIDDRSGLHFTNGIATFSDNIFWNFASNGVPQPYWQNVNAQRVITNAANNNQFVNPQLRAISRTNIPANVLDPRPQFGSPALSSSRTAPNDGFYSPVAYKGAFDGVNLWADGWTFASQVGLLSTNLVEEEAIVQVTANISADATWRSGHEYVLNGFIYVLSNAVLTIEPGTVVRGKAGTGLSSAALFITQGAKIFANGTRAKPIIFTSEADDLFDPNDIPLYTRNLWGGVVIYGRSVLNTASDVAGNAANPKYDLFEGLPDTVINGQHINAYGGNDDNDNSGVMRYCSIRYSSTVILPNKEINALSLCAVGRGTTIENIECFAAGDDSVEFFGGTVNTKYMASFLSDDDNFDIDQGYRGKNQFWFAIAAPDRKDTGGEWNGEPNGIAVGNAPVGNFEIYNATYIGAGPNATGNRAFISREYAAPKIFNTIFTEYNIGANIDARSGGHFTNGLAKFQNNLLWNFASNGVAQPYAQTTAAEWVMTNSANSNIFLDPMLRSISRTNIPAGRLDPRPKAGSPALSSSISAPCDGFYTPVSYKGAFDDNDLWIADWTFASQVGLVPHRPTLGDNTVQVTSNLTGTNNWYRTNQYVLNGFIYVLQGGVLNIEPGTVIRGKAGTGLSSAALFITQGAKINAAGTAHSPIVFTSETDDLDDPADIPLYTRNLWGGVVIYGKSVLNTASDVTGNAASPKFDLFEGLPDTVISGQHINAYGGNDDNDNSGVFRYVSIRYASTVILPNKEINALSLGAVGRGTTIDNIECFAAGDDSVEFFGGTVNTKYMSSIFSDDDNFDIDQGYRGKNQFWFAIAAPDRKDTGGEWNGEPNGIAVGNAPIGNFEIYNATYIGAGTNATGNRAFISREYAAPKVFNSIFTEYNIGANIDARSGGHFTNGLAKFQHDCFWNFASNGVPQTYWQTAAAEWVLTNAANNNAFVDPMLRSVSRTNDPVFQLDPRPMAGSPALTSALTAPNDGFYVPVAYKGAFSAINWAADWGFAAESCLMSGAGAGVPLAPCATTPCIATTLDVVKNGGNVEVTFASVPGVTYRLIGSSDITAPLSSWSVLGTLTATGTSSTFSGAASASQQFLVVVCQ